VSFTTSTNDEKEEETSTKNRAGVAEPTIIIFRKSMMENSTSKHRAGGLPLLTSYFSLFINIMLINSVKTIIPYERQISLKMKLQTGSLYLCGFLILCTRL
jgi:hypothetical protein